MERKVLGVIGGMGPMATQLFYKDIIENTDAQVDQDHIDMIILSHASIPDRTKSIIENTEEAVLEVLKKDTKKLIEAGADFIVIPCNTAHYYINNLKETYSEIPFIDMIEETVKYLKNEKITKVGILATDGTIISGVYENKLKEYEILPILPSESNQKLVMEIIYDEVKAGKAPDQNKFNKVCRELIEKGCQSIILGCTELSYYKIINQLDDFYVDAQRILVLKSIKHCGGKIK